MVKLRELGAMKTVSAWVGVEMEGGSSLSAGTRATYGERAACCDPAAGGGPVRELPAESER